MTGRPHPSFDLLHRILDLKEQRLISDGEGWVLLAMWKHARDDGTLFASGAEIAFVAGKDRSVVFRHLAALRASGYVELVRQGNSHQRLANEYRLRLGGKSAIPGTGDKSTPALVTNRHQGTGDRTGDKSRHQDPEDPMYLHNSVSLTDTELQIAASENGKRTDHLFEAVCHATGVDWHQLTKSQRGRLNRYVGELRAAEADPTEVATRVVRLRLRWGGKIAVTAKQLVDNWANLGDGSESSPGTRHLSESDVQFIRAIERSTTNSKELPE